MKKILITIIILINLIKPANVFALSTTIAKEEINNDTNCNVTLNYYYDDYNFDNTNIKIYHIASITKDFQYNLSSKFSSYPIKINGLKTDVELNTLKQTIDSYIIADNIEELASYSITNNQVNINNLKPGLYFIKTNKIDTKDYTLIFDSFLLNLPELTSDGTWNYNLEVYPKIEEYTPKYEDITYTVTKEWIDNPNTRPKSIEIEIYEDGILVDSHILSSKNNWTYNWITKDDGSTWTVVERNIPKNYNVSITNKNKNFIIINKDSNYKEENPKTLDNINLYFYLLISASIGLILLTISFIINKKLER